MHKKIIILIGLGFLYSISLPAQCPDQEVLWQRIIYLKNISKPPAKEQLAELLPKLDSMNNCANRQDSVHGLLFRRIGTLYFEQTDYVKALQYYRQFVGVIEANIGKPSVNPKELVRGYYWLSVIYDSLNMITEKWNALDNCATIAEKINYIDRASLFSLYKRTVYFFDIGDYYRCAGYALRCETLGREYANFMGGMEYNVGEEYVISSLLMKISALLVLKDYQSAEELLFNKVNECKKDGFINYLGKVYKQLAEVQMHKGNYEKALLFLNEALQFYKKDADWLAYKSTLNRIGLDIYYNHFRNYEKAHSYYLKALNYVSKDKTKEDAFETLNILGNIANVYVQKGIYDSAFYYFQLALDKIKKGVNESDISHGSPQDFIEQEKIYYRTNLLIDQGNAYRKLYEATKQKPALHKALQIYKIADQLLDRIRNELTEFQSRLYWRNYSHRLYENAIQACHLNDDYRRAFYFFEKSRAVLLYDQLNEKSWLGGKDILKQTELQKSIVHLERDFNNTDKNSNRFNEIQKALFIKKHELDILQQQIKTRNPLYYQNFFDTSFIMIEEVQQKILKDHRALVELFVGDSAVYSLIITEHKTYFKKIDKPGFENLSNSFIAYISNPDLLNRNYDAFVKASSQLHQLIFQNISLPNGRIIISPDGKYFPFEALMKINGDKTVSYFLNDHAVSYTYSARYLLNNYIAKSNAGSYNFLGMAPVKYAVNMQVPALPGSDRSLLKLKTYFGRANNLVATNASRNNFMQQFHRYKIIQLYTHATDSGYNGEPMIYFADSALLLSDLVYENKPATSLIVLSACETGRGKLYQGEGVFSFNRGFAALGIPSSISNLWSIDNESTYHITELFYKYLSEGLPIDVALQKAKIEFIKASSKEKQLPYYWAAPILVGQSNAILNKSSSVWKYLIGVSGALAVIFLIWLFLRTKTISTKSSSHKKLIPTQGTKETVS